MRKCTHQGFGFPFLACSLDGLVGKDSVVQRVTSSTSPVAKSVLGRQCFKLENRKCVVKCSHAHYYQCQQILLVTGGKYCDSIVHAESGLNPFDLTQPVQSLDNFKPPSALPIDTMEPEDPTTYICLALPLGEMKPEDPTTCTSSALLDDSLESFSSPITSVSPTLLASRRTFPAGSLYSQQEITAAEALLLSVAGPAYNMKYTSNEDKELSIFP